MQKQSWYRTWFDSPYYHLLYKHRDNEEAAAFIDTLFKYLNPGRESFFLDLACGKGRHSIYINSKGYKICGVDLSKENIRHAKAFENDRLSFEVHDMREVLAENEFHFVLNLFTSFGYFTSMEENEKVLRSVHSELKPKGKLVIDFLNASQVISGLIPSETKVIEGIQFNISRKMEDGSIVKQIEVNDHGEQYLFYEKVQAISRTVFAGMLSRARFEILDTFGNYSLDSFNAETSPRLIIIARKI